MLNQLKKLNRKFLIKDRIQRVVVDFFSTLFALNWPNPWSLLISKRLANLNVVVPTRFGKLKLQSTNTLLHYRANSFFTKEPETIEWLESFSSDDVFYDIGANIGLYSLYTGLRQIQTYSFEPVFYNFSLLNYHIAINNLSNKITAYPIAARAKTQ